MRCLVGRAVLCPPDIFRRLVAPPVKARKTRFKPGSHACMTYPGAQWTARLTDSLRFYCEGLEEKFLERGAPAPLLFRLEG